MKTNKKTTCHHCEPYMNQVWLRYLKLQVPEYVTPAKPPLTSHTPYPSSALPFDPSTPPAPCSSSPPAPPAPCPSPLLPSSTLPFVHPTPPAPCSSPALPLQHAALRPPTPPAPCPSTPLPLQRPALRPPIRPAPCPLPASALRLSFQQLPSVDTLQHL